MYNKVILVGNLTRDLEELRYTPSGTAVLNFGIATNKKYGAGKDETFFGEVVVWGKLAEVCKKYLNKGSKCLIEGRLKTDTWEWEGKKQSKTRIVAEEVKFLSTSQHSEPATLEIPSEETDMEPF